VDGPRPALGLDDEPDMEREVRGSGEDRSIAADLPVPVLPTSTSRSVRRPGGAIIAALPGMDVTVIERCWEDLARLGILESLVNITADFRTATELPRVITSFGHRFIEFISEPIEPSEARHE